MRQHSLLRLLTNCFNGFLLAYGYHLTKTGLGYIDAQATVKAAREAGISLYSYLEGKEKDQRKWGRRDSIIAAMSEAGVFSGSNKVCEIGAGTGMYLEKVLEIAHPERYEVYETDRGWKDYLKSRYGSSGNTNFFFHDADGSSLGYSQDNTFDLVHAHGVFVYLPLLSTMKYIKEMARVSNDGAFIVFDCYLDTSFDLVSTLNWLNTQWIFPVVLPYKLLIDYCNLCSLDHVSSFTVIHGASHVDYLIFQKKTACDV